MAFITEFIDFFVSTITSIWNFVTGLIDSFILFFKYIGFALSTSVKLIYLMPSWLQVFGIITLTVSVLYLLVGRSTGGQKE